MTRAGNGAQDGKIVLFPPSRSQAEQDVQVAGTRESPAIRVEDAIAAGEIHVTLSLDRHRRVTLSAFDVAGRKVATFYEGNPDAGTYHVSWSGRDSRGARVASGIYFLLMNTGDHQVATKALLVR